MRCAWLFLGQLSFIGLHWARGTPIWEDQGEFEELTTWEQLDNGVPWTLTKKVLLLIPLTLYVFQGGSMNYVLDCLLVSRRTLSRPVSLPFCVSFLIKNLSATILSLSLRSLFLSLSLHPLYPSLSLLLSPSPVSPRFFSLFGGSPYSTRTCKRQLVALPSVRVVCPQLYGDVPRL